MKKVYCLYLKNFDTVIMFKIFSSKYKCKTYLYNYSENYEIPLSVYHITDNEGYLKEMTNNIDIFHFLIQEYKVN